MRRIALVNQKGGVGKTTTAVNLGAALAQLGRRVLLVDLDPQSNATLALGYAPGDERISVYEVLRGDARAREALIERAPGLTLLPASLNLAGIELELAQTIGREIVLREALKDLPAYDFLFIDCPPSLGLLNVNALTCADEVFIPLQCEFFALQGIAMLMQTVGLVQRRLNPALRVTGVIPCLYDARKGLAREVVSEIEKHFGERVFRARVRSNVRLAEAPSHGKTIFEYAAESHGAEDYLALAREVAGLSAVLSSEAVPGASEEAGAGDGGSSKRVVPVEGAAATPTFAGVEVAAPGESPALPAAAASPVGQPAASVSPAASSPSLPDAAGVASAPAVETVTSGSPAEGRVAGRT